MVVRIIIGDIHRADTSIQVKHLQDHPIIILTTIISTAIVASSIKTSSSKFSPIPEKSSSPAPTSSSRKFHSQPITSIIQAIHFLYSFGCTLRVLERNEPITLSNKYFFNVSKFFKFRS